MPTPTVETISNSLMSRFEPLNPRAREAESAAFRPIRELMPRFAQAWWETAGAGWRLYEPAADAPPAVHELVNLLRQLLITHYGWGRVGVWSSGRLDRGPKYPQWSWPNVPPVPQRLLEGLERAAKELFPGPGALADPLPPAEDEAPPDVPTTPSWDRANKTLRHLGGEPFVFRRSAPAQFALLDAFEKAGWPPEGIDRPNTLNRQQLKDAVEALNESLAATRLRFDREGKHARWHYTHV